MQAEKMSAIAKLCEVGRSQLTTFPFLSWRFRWWFRTCRSLRCCLIILTASLWVIIVDWRITLTTGSRYASYHWAFGALRLRHLWLCHIMIWRLLVYVIVVTRSVIVNKIAESEAEISRMWIVVNSIRWSIVKLESIDVIASLRDSLKNCFDLWRKKLKRLVKEDDNDMRCWLTLKFSLNIFCLSLWASSISALFNSNITFPSGSAERIGSSYCKKNNFFFGLLPTTHILVFR